MLVVIRGVPAGGAEWALSCKVPLSLLALAGPGPQPGVRTGFSVAPSSSTDEGIHGEGFALSTLVGPSPWGTDASCYLYDSSS